MKPHHYNIKITLCYVGTDFWGWQKIKEGPSIEEALEKALFQILRSPLSLQAASRTDRGVHALGQIANFILPSRLGDLWIDRLPKLQQSLNAVLPHAIRILTIERSPESFHPTLDALGKEYHYFLCIGKQQSPFYRTTSWHVPYPLDLDVIQQAIPHLLGKHDFSAFTSTPYNNPHCNIARIELEIAQDEQLKIKIIGDRFLYKMVRTIVGTLVGIGRQTIDGSQLPMILEQRNRSLAGMTSPAHGLFLKKIFY